MKQSLTLARLTNSSWPALTVSGLPPQARRTEAYHDWEMRKFESGIASVRYYLESTSVAEGESPRFAAGVGVDGVQVNGSLLLGLAARKEGDSGDGRRDGPLESGDGGFGHFFRSVLGLARLTSSDHVRLQESAFQEDVVVVEGLVHGGQHRLGDFLGAIQVVITIGQHLGFDDGHQAVRLADRGVTGQNVGVLQDGLVRRSVLADLEHTAPLGELAAIFLVLGAALVQVVQTYDENISHVFARFTITLSNLGWCTRPQSRKG